VRDKRRITDGEKWVRCREMRKMITDESFVHNYTEDDSVYQNRNIKAISNVKTIYREQQG
jgi:hypothetical protein